ncbi:MAG TPA: hypothetical protein VKV23_05075 [Acidimicrobiales bacterium]|nr:hypothetical protein [Acidimicrobiales bacterium]
MTPSEPPARRVTARVRQGTRALGDVLGTRWRIAGFALVSGSVAFCYTLLLPFDDTQRIGFANWDYLSASLLAWSLALGLAMGLVVSVQAYALRRVVAARTAAGATGPLAFVASLLPSFLCCTPVVPSFLAFVGVSGAGLYATTGTLQHFFAVHQHEFLAASLALVLVASAWGLDKLGRAACAAGGCEPGTRPEERAGRTRWIARSSPTPSRLAGEGPGRRRAPSPAGAKR